MNHHHHDQSGSRYYLTSVEAAGLQDLGAIFGGDLAGSRARIFHPYYAKSLDLHNRDWSNKVIDPDDKDLSDEPGKPQPYLEDRIGSLEWSGDGYHDYGPHLTQIISWLYQAVNHFNQPD